MEVKEFDEAGFIHLTNEDDITFDSWLYEYNDDKDTKITILNHNIGDNPCWYFRIKDNDSLNKLKTFKTLPELLNFMQN